MAEGGNRVSGIVRWFSGQKGFGFIAPDGAGEGEDVFVHQTSIRSDGFRTLAEGETVEFVIDVGEDGRSKAVDVIRLTRSSNGRGRGRGRGGRGGRMGRGGDGGGYGTYDESYDDGGYGRGGIRSGDRRGGRVNGGARGGRGACYNCGRTGHLARDCYQNSGGDRSEFHGSGRGEEGGGRGQGRYGGRRGRGVYNGDDIEEYHGGGVGRGRGGGRSGGGKCYNCGEEGHFARDCLNHQT